MKGTIAAAVEPDDSRASSAAHDLRPSSAAHDLRPSSAAGRAAYALLAAALLSLAAFEALSHSTGLWQFFVFGAGPDLALLLGAARGLAPGQLHPRAVPVYNLLHRFWGPLALAIVVVAGPLGVGYLVGALAWGLHISFDRAVGYGLRTPDGFQRS